MMKKEKEHLSKKEIEERKRKTRSRITGFLIVFILVLITFAAILGQ